MAKRRNNRSKGEEGKGEVVGQSHGLPSRHQPYWLGQVEQLTYPALSGNLEVDVCVIGAGITGVTTAMRLLQAGRKVVILDMNRLGGGTTGHSTGHLDGHFDQSIQTLLEKFGEDRARAITAAKKAAVDLVEAWDREFSLASMFRRVPAYLYAESREGSQHIEREYEAARKVGLSFEPVDRVPLPFPIRKGMVLSQQGRFNPLKYVHSLVRAFTSAGGRIFEGTLAERIEEKDGRVKVWTNHGQVTADAVMSAGHAPLVGPLSLQVRSYPKQSYVIAVRVRDEVPDALFWDTAEPYHYTRWASSEDPRLLIIGGADHPTGERMDTQRSFSELENYARQRYQVEGLEARWSSEYYITADTVPLIGKAFPLNNVYVGTGYSGDGLTFGTVAGMICSDLIMGRPNEWARAFTPARIKPVASAKRFISGTMHMAQHFLGSRLRGGEVRSLDQIAPQSGAVMVIKGQRLAVYRDENNTLHALSPYCRHMGCVVNFNEAEKTWDCPCHGGRYNSLGKVISGPPMSSLQRMALPVEE